MPSPTSSTLGPIPGLLASQILATAIICLPCGLSEAATLPTAPQTFTTTYVAPTGKMITVAAGGDFQAALNAAQLGDTIVLQAGATYTGPFTLPNKTAGNGWIFIQSSAYSALPAPGLRVGPSNASNMPKIIATAAGGSAVQTVANSHSYRFVGIEFTANPGDFIYTLIVIGNTDTTAATLPNKIVIDRCYIHGDPNVGGRRGLEMDGTYVATVDSYFMDFKQAGYDTQAAWAYNTVGPLQLVDNHFEAAGESVMFGGADSVIPNAVPSDIEIRRNDFYKPLSWVGSQWQVKNLLELKNSNRVLIDGNIFENIWDAAQDGFALLITPRNQGNTAPWSATQDITISNNQFQNVGGGIDISGEDSPNTSQHTDRVLIRNNVINAVGLNASTGTGFATASGRIFQITGGPDDLTINHNTAFTATSYSYAENTPVADQFAFTNNIMANGQYGFGGTGTGVVATLTSYFSNWTFTHNAIIGAVAGNYPTGNFFPISTAAVQFTNYAAGDYHLLSASPYVNAATDGTAIGADVNAIAQAYAGTNSIVAPNAPTNVIVK